MRGDIASSSARLCHLLSTQVKGKRDEILILHVMHVHYFVLSFYSESLVIVMVKFVRKDRGGEGVNWSIFTL